MKWGDRLEGKQKHYGHLMTDLFDQISPSLRGDSFWENNIRKIKEGNDCPGIHLAVFVDPYLTFILQGKKTVESRFSIKRIPPYNQIFRDDIILLKFSGGPIIGICSAGDVWNYQLDPESWSTIKKEFTESLCAQDPAFWAQRKRAAFATLIKIKNSRKIEPVFISKHDRRGWVVVQKRELQTKLI